MTDPLLPAEIPTPGHRLAAIRAAKAERQRQRAELERRRQHGHTSRHTARLAHHRTHGTGDTGSYRCPTCHHHYPLHQIVDHLASHTKVAGR